MCVLGLSVSGPKETPIPPNSKKQSKYPEVSSTWTIGGFLVLNKSQRSSGTIETSSYLPKGIIPLPLAEGT